MNFSKVEVMGFGGWKSGRTHYSFICGGIDVVLVVSMDNKTKERYTWWIGNLFVTATICCSPTHKMLSRWAGQMSTYPPTDKIHLPTHYFPIWTNHFIFSPRKSKRRKTKGMTDLFSLSWLLSSSSLSFAFSRLFAPLDCIKCIPLVMLHSEHWISMTIWSLLVAEQWTLLTKVYCLFMTDNSFMNIYLMFQLFPLTPSPEPAFSCALLFFELNWKDILYQSTPISSTHHPWKTHHSPETVLCYIWSLLFQISSFWDYNKMSIFKANTSAKEKMKCDQGS